MCLPRNTNKFYFFLTVDFLLVFSRHFVGSRESTFSFRIQEEREIMGFQTKSTFDMLCPDGEFDCTKGSTWKIVWPDKPNPPKPEEAAPLPARTLPTATPVKINVTSAGKKVPTDYPPAPPAPIPAAPKPLPPAPPAPKATRAPEKPPKSQQTLEKESEKRTEEKESGKDGKTEL